MSKAASMAKITVKGGFHLLWGLAASTIITSIGVIILARLLSPDDFGLYTIALAVPNLIQLFRDWGTSYAIVNYSAKFNLENNQKKVKEIVFSGLFFQSVLAVLLTAIMFLSSDFLAGSLFQRPDVGFLIQIVSLSLLSGSFVSLIQTMAGTSTSASQATFIGLEKTEFNSLSLLVLSIIRTILTSLLVIFGLGAFGAVAGYTVSLILAGLISLFLFLFVYFKLPKMSIREMKIIDNLKIMVRYGFPLSLVTILRGFLHQYYLIILAINVSDALIGNYSVATNFVVLITFFATPVKTMLFPAFSKLDPVKDSVDFKNVFKFSVKYGALLVVPFTFLVISLSQPAVYTLFGSQYASSPMFLSMLAILYLYSAFGFLSITNLLNGQGKTGLNLKRTILTVIFGLTLGFILITQFGVVGLIFTILVAEVPSLVLGLFWIKKSYGLNLDWISSLKILLSSGLASILTYVVVTQLEFASWIELVLGVVVFAVLFLFGSLFLRTVDRFDLDNLRGMTKSLGPLHKLFIFVFNFYEKLMVALNLE